MYKGKVPGVYNEWPECQAQWSGSQEPAIKGLIADKKQKIVT